MKKSKKIIVLVMACVMMFGATLTVQAASACFYCGQNQVASTSTGRSCNLTGCGAPVTFYACSDCHSGWYMCSNYDFQ